jgi:hypothetical protein
MKNDKENKKIAGDLIELKIFLIGREKRKKIIKNVKI